MVSLSNSLMQQIKYKVIVRQSLGIRDWKDFHTVILVISLDNKRFVGDYFRSILCWAKERFETIHVIVADTLQRHNIALLENTQLEQAKNISLKRGDEWIAQSNDIFKEMKIIPTIDRWDDWLLRYRNDYQQQYQDFLNLCETNQYIHSELKNYFDSLWKRLVQSKNLNQQKKEAFNQDVFMPYFLEETVLTSVFLSVLKGVIAYPGSLPKLWGYFTKEEHGSLNGFSKGAIAHLDFKRN